jgi:hypothetical protein
MAIGLRQVLTAFVNAAGPLDLPAFAKFDFTGGVRVHRYSRDRDQSQDQRLDRTTL